MASASAADTWRDSGARSGRPLAGPQLPRPDLQRQDATPARSARMSLPPVPPPHPRGRPDPRGPEPRGSGGGPGGGADHGRPVSDARPPAARPQQRTPYPGVHPLADRDAPQAPARRSRPVDRLPVGDGARDGARYGVRDPGQDDGRDGVRDPGQDGGRDGAQRRSGPRGSSRSAPTAADLGTGVRGSLAVLGVFVITLAGGAVDSFLAIGLGTLTLVTLVAASAVATLLVRKRDLLTVVTCPPLVFVLVATVNIGLAPSVSFSLPTIATVLIRGFPTMAVATAVTLVVAVVRWAARR